MLAAAAATMAMAQRPRSGREKDEEPPYEVVTITTKDGVALRAAYFSSDQGKDAVPVMVVHEWKGQASPYLPLGMALKKAGCAVLIPDLRGHGGSKTRTLPGGASVEIDPEEMTPVDVKAILAGDLEACKKFLREKNDKEELNLNALCLIGVGEGAVFAMEWAVRDWGFPSIGSKKQGQDVKAMVFLSPEDRFKVMKMDTGFRDGTVWRLPYLLVAGKESSEARDAEKIYRRLKALKKRVSRGALEGLEVYLPPGRLSGVTLLRTDPKATAAIVEFITDNLASKITQFQWIPRDQ